MKLNIVLSFLFLAMLGCVASASKGVMDTGDESQLKIRQMQTRYFDTADKKKSMECAIATLQDLGFVIDKASLDLGTVSATKLSGYNLRMTVNVVPRAGGRMMVRASAQFNVQVVDDPLPYQQFFDAFSKSMFLDAHLDES
jgi:competence protein ComGC